MVYTCQEFTATTATAMGVPAVTQTITEASFEVEVVGRVTGTAPPANVTIVSFRLGLTFDETPSPAVKQEVFTAVSAQTKTTLQTTAPGAGVDVFVREDAGRRRLASVSVREGGGDVREAVMRSTAFCDPKEGHVLIRAVAPSLAGGPQPDR